MVLARLALGGMFAYLAVRKLLNDPMTFAKAVHQYQVLPQDPPELANVITIVLPWLELVCAIAVLLGLFLRGAAALMLAQLLVFTPSIYMFGIKLFNQGKFDSLCKINFDCGCGTEKEYFCTKLATNLGLMAAAVIILKSRSRLLCLSQRWCRSRSAGTGSDPPKPLSSPSATVQPG